MHLLHRPYEDVNRTRVSLITKRFFIVIETIEGTISVEIKKEDGTVIFYQENLETGTYEVEASGKYTVRVTADDHKGGFYIGE